ncbi:helix-turn-helix domain-containing protein [Pseudooceanicola sp. 200-1SW]|uniref:helix-turn-helix domain-containing protein n=1 Tax=Pseudooceanicola sp. 200-1SW TaxID=3425949 RepID=UPI003D7FBCDC
MTDQAGEHTPTEDGVSTLGRSSEIYTPSTEAAVPLSPAQHIRNLGRVRSEHQWEVVREYLHPMVMQNYSGAAIAEAFGISIDTAYRWRKRLLADLREEAVRLQPRDFIMESLSSLRRARAEAWEQFEGARDPQSRRACLNLIIQTENHFSRIGERIGMYGGRGEKPMAARTYNENSDDDEQGVRALREMLYSMFSGISEEVSEGQEADPESYEELLEGLFASEGSGPR